MDFLDDAIDSTEAASMNECTGLYSTLPEDGDEAESVRRLFPVAKQKTRQG